jgi:hypothetical protein
MRLSLVAVIFLARQRGLDLMQISRNRDGS